MSTLLTLLIGFFIHAQTPSADIDPLWIEAQLQPVHLRLGESGVLKLRLKLPEKYHAYSEQFKLEVIEPEGFLVGSMALNPEKKWFDKFSKRERMGIEGEAVLTATIEAPQSVQLASEKIKIALTYQACTDTFCLFPKTKNVDVAWNPPPAFSENKKIYSASTFHEAMNQHVLLAFLLVFFAGILTSFTPCIFPMIPITLALLGHDSEKRSRRQNFLLSLVYVHGIALTYSLLGLLAVSTGQLFGSVLGNPWIVGSLCLLMLAMALSLFGLFDIQLPGVIRNYLGQHKTETNYAGAFISGLLAGIVASPCVGPILVGILSFVASQKNYALGFFLLFTYAMGMGLIFIFLGVFTEFTRKLPRSGPWMVRVKIFLGALMMIGFYYYLQFVLPNTWWDLSIGLGLFLLPFILGIRAKPTSKMDRVYRSFLISISAVGLIWSTMALRDLLNISATPIIADSLPAEQKLPWTPWSEESYTAALQSGKPIMIDFWADWCVACHELEQWTFTDPRVRSALEGFILLKFDATKDSATLKELKKKYSIQGLPTLIFYNSHGALQSQLTLTEFEKAELFLGRLGKVDKQKSK